MRLRIGLAAVLLAGMVLAATMGVGAKDGGLTMGRASVSLPAYPEPTLPSCDWTMTFEGHGAWGLTSWARPDAQSMVTGFDLPNDVPVTIRLEHGGMVWTWHGMAHVKGTSEHDGRVID